MRLERANALYAPAAIGSYTQAVRLTDSEEPVFVSGQVPKTADLKVPQDFDGQCRLVWWNIELQLKEFGIGLDNMVKVTTFLSHPSQRGVQSDIRNEVLGDHQPASTVIICDIYSSKWLLEIEAIAAR